MFADTTGAIIDINITPSQLLFMTCAPHHVPNKAWKHFNSKCTQRNACYPIFLLQAADARRQELVLEASFSF